MVIVTSVLTYLMRTANNFVSVNLSPCELGNNAARMIVNKPNVMRDRDLRERKDKLRVMSNHTSRYIIKPNAEIEIFILTLT